MSRRDDYLHKQHEKKISDLISKIYLSTITESLFDAGVQTEDIKYILNCIKEKADNLSKGYIGLDDYIEAVEEKTGVPLKIEETDNNPLWIRKTKQFAM